MEGVTYGAGCGEGRVVGGTALWCFSMFQMLTIFWDFRMRFRLRSREFGCFCKSGPRRW